mgnify:CR=1 FL=1
MNKSIHHSEVICNYLKSQNLTHKLSDYVLGYLISIIITVFCTGYKGKTVDFERHSDRHRTSISRFLKSEKWNDDVLESTIKQIVLNTIYEESRNSGKPILFIVDDTISSKTKPSSKAMHPIESAGFHFSHLKMKRDYGHQAIGIMLSCNGITLNYRIIMYDKSKSKIELVKEIAEELPVAPNISYLLCDSWYVCGKLMEAFISKGFYTVGALKTNRIIYPFGVKMNIREFAKKISKDDSLFCIVTVKGRKYHIFRYEGNINGVENVVVLISYPVGALGKEKGLRAFISTNAALSTEEILELYVKRWDIEVFFRDSKSKLALDKYQIRSSKAIRRFWLIASLAHLIACSATDDFNFSKGYKIIKNKIYMEQIDFIFEFAKNGGDKSALLSMVA